MSQPIICISRQFGSGGSRVSKLISQKLDIPYYDKDIINKASENSGVSRDLIERSDEKRTSSFLYALSTLQMSNGLSPGFQFNDIINDDRVFLITSKTIKQLAVEPCVIVGRCADYILKDRNIISVFICSDFGYRLKNITEHFELDEKQATKLIRQTDKKRASYYNSFTDRNWGSASNYDLCVSTSTVSEEFAANTIIAFANQVAEHRAIKKPTE